MGTLFSGDTEDLLLYVALPLSLIALVITIFILEHTVSRRLHSRRSSWFGPLTSRSDSNVGYRAPAASRLASRAPRSVRWLVRPAVAWAAATVSFWLFVTVCAAPTIGVWPALVLLLTGVVASARLVQTSLALCDRHDVTVTEHIGRSRTWLLVHHGVVLLVGTALLGGAVRGQSTHLVELFAAYVALVVAPALVALGLVRGLQGVRALYVPEPETVRSVRAGV